MAKNYQLYLDEILPNGPLEYFCLAGIAIEDTEYVNSLVPDIKRIKNEYFGNENIVLHDFDMKAKVSGFRRLNNAAHRKGFWGEIQGQFQKHDFTVFSVCIHEKDLKALYPNMRDKYFISLQVIIENYVHFLHSKGATGNMFIESRTPKQDSQLQNHFHTLKATGTLFYENNALQDYLGTISFPSKGDNIIGLQIADLIPNPLNRELSSMKQKEDGLIDIIRSKAYQTSHVTHSNRFGIKIIP